MVALFRFLNPSVHRISPYLFAPCYDCQGGCKCFRSCRYPNARANPESSSSVCLLRVARTRRSDADREILSCEVRAFAGEPRSVHLRNRDYKCCLLHPHLRSQDIPCSSRGFSEYENCAGSEMEPAQDGWRGSN